MTRRRWVSALLAVLLAAALPGRLRAEDGSHENWPRFEVILWHDHGPAALAEARRLGVTASMILGTRGTVDAASLRQRAEALRAAGLGFYVENIATDFYAAYHRWTPEHPVTWLFDEAQALHRRDPADPAAFVRTPSLSDAAWQARIAGRLAAHAEALGSLHPLYYSLGDETGIADLAAAWDFDLSPTSLTAMRTWLRGEYGSLAALNQEWGSSFARWDAVVPMLTDAALARSDGNFAAWADFKAWMDVAFARAVRNGTDALHAADPTARAAIEGAQIPGWGGYDYTHLAAAVDVMEIYEFADNIEIATALNPALVVLTTSGAAGPAEWHRLWHLALLGGRGAVLWDPEGQIARADGTPGANGLALAPLFADLHGAAGARLLASRPTVGPVGILYSPASEHLRWLLDRRADAARGAPAWSTRDAEAELADTAPRAARRHAVRALVGRGIMPRWLTPGQLAAGGLQAAGLRVLLLPQAIALGDAELAAIHDFAAKGGVVLADVPPGAFDAHGRRRAAPPADAAVRLLAGFAPAAIRAAVAAAGVAAPVTLTRPDGTPVDDAEIRVRRVGAATLIGVLRDQPADGVAPDGGEDAVLTLPAPARVRDLLAGAPAQPTARVALRLDPARPALLEVTPGG